jgi:hypothetical protein
MKKGKKIFKILNRTDNFESYILFQLNLIIVYDKGYGSRFISCAKSYPFNTWKIGDCLEIDLDKICCSGNNTIYDTSIIRILDEDAVDEIRKSQIELYELKNTKDKLIPLLNSFSQKIINKNFFDTSVVYDGGFAFDEIALPV